MEKNKQEKIAASELRYRRLFETAQDGILIIDGETGKIYDANPFLLTMVGYTLKDLLDKELWELGFFKDKKEAKLIFKQLQEKGYIRYEHLPLENNKKEIVEVEFICNSYLVGGDKVIQCNVRDISKRVAAERLLAKHNKAIEKLNKVVVGRESKMIDLKKELANLSKINAELKAQIELLLK